MRILVVGASGRTGRLVVEDALSHGHDVTAFVRDPLRLDLPAQAPLTVATGDMLDLSGALEPTVAGHDVVVSLLAPRHEHDERLYSRGTANLIEAMDAAGVDRLVAVSAEGVRVARGILPLGYRAVLLLPGLDDVYDDIGLMEDAVIASDLVWTLVRPAVLTDGPATGTYRTALGDTVPGGLRVSRADVAAFLLNIMENDRYRRERVSLAD
jgi:putative NADH-flavin reductase